MDSPLRTEARRPSRLTALLRACAAALSVCAVFLTAGPVQAATITVATSAELQDRLGAVGPGDTLFIRRGAYTLTRLPGFRDGTAEKPITFLGEDSGAVIIGQGGGYSADQMFYIDKSGLTFKYLHFKAAADHIFHITDGGDHFTAFGCIFEGAVDVTFKQSLTVSATRKGADWPWPDYGLIENCLNMGPGRFINMDGMDYLTVRGCVSRPLAPREWTLYHCYVKGGSGFAVFENNLILGGGHEVGISFGNGHMSENFHPSMRRAVYNGQTFVSKGPEAYECIARNNVVRDMGDYAFHVSEADGGYFLHNTVVKALGMLQDQGGGSTRIEARNNIFIQCQNPVDARATASNNYVSATLDTTLFWGVGANNFRLRPAATALLGKAPLLAAVPRDLLGKARPSPAAYGAYESYNGAAETVAARPAEPRAGDGIRVGFSPPGRMRPKIITVRADRALGLLDLAVRDMHGRHVRRLRYDALREGTLEIIWDGRDERGRVAPGGRYILVAGFGLHKASWPFSL